MEMQWANFSIFPANSLNVSGHFFLFHMEFHAPVTWERPAELFMYGVRHGPQWKDAPRGHGPYKTLHNRFFRWSRMGVFKASLRSPQKRRTMMDG